MELYFQLPQKGCLGNECRNLCKIYKKEDEISCNVGGTTINSAEITHYIPNFTHFFFAFSGL